MIVTKTKLDGCVIVVPKVFADKRGFFMESYHFLRYSDIAGIKLPMIQDNHSRSAIGVLRGLHFQKTKPQGKLVRVTSGAVYDVAVDIRTASPTFGQWEALVLSEENKKQFWIPPGFAHGFVVLSKTADLQYKCTDYYDPLDEGCIVWNDPNLNIPWPVNNPLLSSKDLKSPFLADLNL